MLLPEPPSPLRSKSFEVSSNTAGHRSPNTFLWLEDLDAEDTRTWVQAQDERTSNVLQQLSSSQLVAELTELLSVRTHRTEAIQRGDWIFEARPNISDPIAWIARNAISGVERILVGADPEASSSAARNVVPNWSGTLVAVVRAGSVEVKDVISGEVIDVIRIATSLPKVFWEVDGTSFVYVTAEIEDVAVGVSPKYTIVRHLLLDSEQDATMLEIRGKFPTYIALEQVGSDRTICCYTWYGADARRSLSVLDRSDQAFRQIFPERTAYIDVRHRIGNSLYVITDLFSPKRQLVSVPLHEPQIENWTTILDTGEVLSWVEFLGLRMVVAELVLGWSRLYCCDLDGNERRDVVLPSLGLAFPFVLDPTLPVLRLRFSSLAEFEQVLEVDKSGDLQVPEPSIISPGKVVVRQTLVQARDGTKIPLTLARMMDAGREASGAGLLHTYGGFGSVSSHGLGPLAFAWMRLGGLYAIAHTRGGGEGGREWHDAAKTRRHLTAITDLVDCGRYLIFTEQVQPGLLCAHGFSNGGLNVASAAILYPNLFGSVLCDMPPTDMVRYTKFASAIGWMSEFGDPDDPDDLAAILQYSPLHNIVSDRIYPPFMVTTGDRDVDVLPCHSYKLVAALQSVASPSVVLLQICWGRGHRDEVPIIQVINQITFLLDCVRGGIHKAYSGMLARISECMSRNYPASSPKPL